MGMILRRPSFSCACWKKWHYRPPKSWLLAGRIGILELQSFPRLPLQFSFTWAGRRRWGFLVQSASAHWGQEAAATLDRLSLMPPSPLQFIGIRSGRCALLGR